MLISLNNAVDNSDFEELLYLSVKTLNLESAKLSEKYLKLLGVKLEKEWIKRTIESFSETYNFGDFNLENYLQNKITELK